MQVAWPVAHRGCHPVAVADGEPDRIQRTIVLRAGHDEGEQRDVVTGPNLAEQRLDGRLERRSRLASPPDPLADGRRIALAEDFLGEVLCLLHVRLVEDVDAENGTGDRDRVLPAEELRSDRQRIPELERHDRMARLGERGQGARLVVTGERQPDKEAIVAVDLRDAERLVGDRNQALALFARALRDQLLGPDAEALDRGRCDDRDLVAPDLRRLGEDRSQPGPGVLPGRDGWGARLHHGRRPVEQARNIDAAERRRYETEVREGRVAAADVRRVEKGSAEPAP